MISHSDQVMISQECAEKLEHTIYDISQCECMKWTMYFLNNVQISHLKQGFLLNPQNSPAPPFLPCLYHQKNPPTPSPPSIRFFNLAKHVAQLSLIWLLSVFFPVHQFIFSEIGDTELGLVYVLKINNIIKGAKEGVYCLGTAFCLHPVVLMIGDNSIMRSWQNPVCYFNIV